MTPAPLSIGIVGCGRMGRQHASTCVRLGHRIAFVSDAVSECAQALAADCAGAAVVQVDGVRPEQVDAVIVCTPPSARGAIECRAAQNGTAFFAEKPVGLHSNQLEGAWEALRSSTAIHSVGYMNRYRESVRQARHALAGKEIIGLSASWAAGKYSKPWWGNRDHSGGPFNEQCTHFVDLFRYYLGDIDEVMAIADSPDDLQSAAVVCRFTSGVCGTLLYSCQSQSKQMSFTILCRDGSIELSGYDLAFAGSCQPVTDVWSAEIEVFCQAVQERRQDIIESSFHDGIRTQLTVDAIGEAMDTGRRVSVRAPSWCV